MKLGLLPAVLATALLGAPAVQAQDPRHELELRVGADQLSNETPDWRAYELHGRWALAPLSLRAGLRQVERFDLDDQDYLLGADVALTPAWTLGLDLSHSPDHAFLPELGVQGQVSWAAGAGWVLGLAGRRSEYTDDTVTLGILSVEKYLGAFRAAYSLFRGTIEDGGSGTTHVAQLDWFYTERSRVGLNLSDGREVTRIDPQRVEAVAVSGVTLLGTHWLDPRWGLNWSLGHVSQGDFYDRSGVQLGLVYRY